MYNYGVTGSSINEFQDVVITGILDDQILQYNATTNKWENVTASATLNDATDVVLTSPAEFQVLEYNGTNWINKYASVATEVRNADTVTLATGTAVYLFGANGDIATVKRADNDSEATSSKVVGLVGAPIAQNNSGPVITRGYVDGIDLSVGYSPGDILYLGEDGGFTKTKPVAPEHTVFLGVVCRANANGIVYVATQNGYELDELHNVKINGTLADNDVLQYDSATSLWKNTALADVGMSLDNLSDAAVLSASIGQVLEHNGTNFVNKTVFAHTGLQAPVNTRKYGPIGVVTTAISGINVGSCSVIRFKSACSITALSIYLNATYSAATTYDYRLGIYADSNGAPGSLLVDAGTVSIATGATAGFKTITLGSAQSVAANTPVWLVCAATHSGTVPNLTHQAGNLQPYSDYGLSGSTHTQAACLAYLTGPATALPNPFVLASPETQPAGVAVYATVSVP